MKKNSIFFVSLIACAVLFSCSKSVDFSDKGALAQMFRERFDVPESVSVDVDTVYLQKDALGKVFYGHLKALETITRAALSAAGNEANTLAILNFAHQTENRIADYYGVEMGEQLENASFNEHAQSLLDGACIMVSINGNKIDLIWAIDKNGQTVYSGIKGYRTKEPFDEIDYIQKLKPYQTDPGILAAIEELFTMSRPWDIPR